MTGSPVAGHQRRSSCEAARWRCAAHLKVCHPIRSTIAYRSVAIAAWSFPTTSPTRYRQNRPARPRCRTAMTNQLTLPQKIAFWGRFFSYPQMLCYWWGFSCVFTADIAHQPCPRNQCRSSDPFTHRRWWIRRRLTPIFFRNDQAENNAPSERRSNNSR